MGIYNRSTVSVAGLTLMITFPLLWAYITVLPVPLGLRPILQ